MMAVVSLSHRMRGHIVRRSAAQSAFASVRLSILSLPAYPFPVMLECAGDSRGDLREFAKP
jgi:hypothetical protein